MPKVKVKVKEPEVGKKAEEATETGGELQYHQERQKELNDLIERMRQEGATSIGKLEVKLSQHNQRVAELTN